MNRKSAVWVVIQMARSEKRARDILDRLSGEGFLINLRAVPGEISQGEQVYEVLALSSEAKEARALLIRWGL